MKKNGFVSTSLIYTFFVLFLFLMVFLLNSYSSNRFLTEQFKNDIKNTFAEASNADINLFIMIWDDLSGDYELSDEIPTFGYYFENSYKKELSDQEINSFVNKRDISYEDACLFLYLKSLLVGFNTNHIIKEVVIDEAQDYNKLQYEIIKRTFKTANYTILGDTNQTINPYYKYTSLEELTSLFDSSKYITLTKTYRSTYKIIAYTNKILGLNHVTAIRNQKASDIIFRNNPTKEEIIGDINNLKEISKSIAIITKDDTEAEEIFNLIKNDTDVALIDGFSHIKRDLVIMPSYVAKGLEFDSVISYNSPSNRYTDKDKYLYYVTCSRAQHNLIIYNGME